MNRFFYLLTKILVIISLFSFSFFKVYAEELDEALKQLREDIKTLEKAVYSQDVKTSVNDGELSAEESEMLTILFH